MHAGESCCVLMRVFCMFVCLRIVFLLLIQKPTCKFTTELNFVFVGLVPGPTCRFLWLNVLGSNICRGACDGKNAHKLAARIGVRNGQSVGPMITRLCSKRPSLR